MSSERADCVVAGAGPAGLITALALAREGFDVRIIGPRVDEAVPDPRTTALFAGSVSLLRNLGIWPHLQPRAAPLCGLRLIDDIGGLLHAPETLFAAGELGLDVFGYNVDNADLIAGLLACVRAEPRISVITGMVCGVEWSGEHVALQLASGAKIDGGLAVAADGRNSATRAGAGIAVDTWSYPQCAVVTRFQHSRSHDGISTEFHRTAGPLTTVPLPGHASSLVWVEQPAEADRLMRLAPDAFARELEERLQGLLGTVCDIAPRASFPLSGLTAQRMAARRVALVGEAGHVLPPIGAQGLNLGFRDAATLAEEGASARAAGDDPWGEQALSRYDERRRADVLSRTLPVDLLNRSLLSGFEPFHLARVAGLQMIGSLPWLRQLVMREGMQPSLRLPRLMESAEI
ncbi:MAG: FAD-dependent monooxygenase [Bacteroidota bacterium]